MMNNNSLDDEKKLGTPEKLRQILEFFHLNNEQFAQKIGVPTGKLYDINRGQIKNFSIEVLEKILETCPEISPIWLITGKGSMLVTGGSSNTAVGNSGNVEQGRNVTINSSPEDNARFDRLIALLEKEHEERTRLLSVIEKLTNK